MNARNVASDTREFWSSPVFLMIVVTSVSICREEEVRGGDEEAKVGVSETVMGDVESRPTTLEVPVHRAPRTPQDPARVHKAHLK